MVNVNKKNTKMDFFIDWLHKNGAEFPNLHIIHQKKNERGVKTSGKISKNKTVIKIPRKLLIYSEMGKNTKWGQQLQNYTKRTLISPDIIYILIYMIKRMDSAKAFHFPYFDILPRDMGHFPIFWNKSDLKYLENSHLLNLIKKRKYDLNYDYTTLCLALEGFEENYSWNEFMWLRSIIGSRNFGIVIKNKKQAAMVPLSDMLNHSMKPDVNWHFNNTKDSFVMESNKALSSNQEISDSYGSKCNSKYMLYYGFALHGSEKDRNTILFEIPQQILKGYLYTEKLHFIKSHFKCALTNNFSSVEFNNLMRFLRIANANKKELEIIKKKINIAINPINKRNECSALTHLALYTKHELNKYPLSIHQNKANLKQLKSYSNASFATKLVIGEKEILKNIIEFSKMSLEVLLFKRRFSPRKLKNNMKGYMLLLNDMD